MSTTSNASRARTSCAGGFPPGAHAGHDHDYARLRLLGLLSEQNVAASVANDFADVEKWLPVSRLLITYVAGPYPNAAQTSAMQEWIEAGGHWLGLHGTSGGRAERVEGMRSRRTVKSEHHALLGGFFLTHPPIRKFRVDVHEHALTRGMGTSFEVEDEPYFVELQDPASTRVLLSAAHARALTLYRRASALRSIPRTHRFRRTGRRDVLGYTREIGRGSVTFLRAGALPQSDNSCLTLRR